MCSNSQYIGLIMDNGEINIHHLPTILKNKDNVWKKISYHLNKQFKIAFIFYLTEVIFGNCLPLLNVQCKGWITELLLIAIRTEHCQSFLRNKEWCPKSLKTSFKKAIISALFYHFVIFKTATK